MNEEHENYYPYLSDKLLARRWGISYRTLQGWRNRNMGPVYIRIGGGVRYSIEAIIAYEREYMFGTDQQENLDSYIPPMDYSKENE